MASENATDSPAPHGTTAPVLEYICLFTKDLRKKQKKWQDGRLKFHTYNKKVMVYDERGYNVGHMHWRRDYDLADGEELELESGGTQVQVCECIGTQEQDISGLVDKRVQEREQRAIKVAARLQQSSSVGGSRPIVRQSPNDHFQLRQLPLNQVLGTPTGHHGRALVPSESPFEQRQRAPPNDETPRPTKRPRREPSPPAKSGYAQNLFGTKLHLSSQPSSSLWQRTPRPTAPAAENPQRKPAQAGQPAKKPEPAPRKEPKTPAVVDLIDDDGDDHTEKNDNRNHVEVPETSTRANMPSRQVRNAEKATKKRMAPVQTSDIEATPLPRSLNQPVPKKPRLSDSTPLSSPEIVELNSPPAALSKPHKTLTRPPKVATTETRRPRPEPEPLPDKETDPAELLEDDFTQQSKQKTALRIKSRKKRGLMMLSSNNVEASSDPEPRESRKHSNDAFVNPQDTDSGLARESGRDVATAKTKKQRGEKPTEQHPRLPSPSPALTDKSRDTSPAGHGGIEPPEKQTKQRGKARARANERAVNSASETNSTPETRNDPPAAAKSSMQKGGKRARARPNVLVEEDSDSNETFESHSKAAQDPKNRNVHPDVASLLFDDDSDASNDWVPPPPTCQNLAKISESKKKQEIAKPTKALDRVREDSEPPAGQMRLEKLGRKSVKSREIIGWVFDQPPAVSFGPRAALPLIASQLARSPSPDPVPSSVIENPDGPPMSPPDIVNDVPTSSELAQLIETPVATSKRAPDLTIGKASADSLPKTVPDFTEKTTAHPVQETTLDVAVKNVVPVSASKPIAEGATKTTPDPAPVINSRPRIANPATRGRKAAVRSDAQGKVPQHILPTDPNSMPRKDVLQALATMMAASANEAAALLPSQIEPPPAAPERPKIKMKLPGFAPAGASVGDVLGPWTREAYDLLGMGRPSR
ncbi:hypothetical protein PspLS_08015 [Pyricularia sp. CBS 133598]|nr:hypothetical protein PspLS_08015 [Pyricularia sp. CBS 133598]